MQLPLTLGKQSVPDVDTVTLKETAQLQDNNAATAVAWDITQPCVRRPGLTDITSARAGTSLEDPVAADITTNYPAEADHTEAQAEALHTDSTSRNRRSPTPCIQ